MARRSAAALEALVAVGEGAPPMEEKVQLMRDLRRHFGAEDPTVDVFVLERLTAFRGGLEEARQAQQELGVLLKTLTAPPLFPATFLQPVDMLEGRGALVAHGSAQLVVTVLDEVDLEALRTGDTVLLGEKRNTIVALSKSLGSAGGETAAFRQRLDDGRLLLQVRDEAFVARPGCGLDGVDLAAGDLVRWERNHQVALERIEREEGREFLLQDVPDEERDAVGGQQANLATLVSTLTAALSDRARAARYGIDGTNSVLLVGPPGTGKTLMTRVAVSEMGRMSGKPCRFAVVKPGEWLSEWYGRTEANIRNCFATCRREAEQGRLVVLVLDEVECIGRHRGGSVSQHSDRALTALLTELDGFAARKDLAVVALTNRKDLVDPALLSRLSDEEIVVGRPDMEGARQIFRIHMGPDYRYSPNSNAAAAATREEIVETGVSKLYSPNAENAICTIMFRDGTRRRVRAGELASGRMIEQCCRGARRRALWRDQCGGEPGIRVRDMEEAVAQVTEGLRTSLTTANAHLYLQDLPQDVDVVSVEATRPKVRRLHRYIHLGAPETGGEDA